jgi:adhesin transport system outer membrane protein
MLSSRARPLRTAAIGLVMATVAAALPVSRTAAMTLEEAIRYALTTNPEIGEARANRMAIDHELEQARGLYLPQVDVEALGGPEWVDNSTTAARGRPRGDWLERWELSVVLQQRIFDGFEARSEVERQAARVDAAAYRVLERSEFIGLDVVQAYLDVMRNAELVELARRNEQIHRQILGNVLRLVDAGEASIADAQQARERLFNAERIVIDFERDFDEARITYQRVVGQPAGEMVLPDPPTGALPPDLEVAVAVALETNPTIRIGLAELDVSYAELRAAEAPFYPSVSLESTASVGDNIDGNLDEESQFNVLLVARYRLFNGFIDRAARQEQVARVAEARHQLDRFRRDVEELVRQSWTTLQASLRNVPILERQVVSAREVVGSYREQYAIGARTLLDVLDAENELFNARVSLTSTRFASVFGQYRVLASTGQLLPTLSIEAPAASDASARDYVGGVTEPQPSQIELDDDFYSRRRPWQRR